MICRFPSPKPLNKSNLLIANYTNIDPLWSDADGKCATQIFNVLGKIKIYKGIRIANLIGDWDIYNCPIFTVGFNPKTNDLLNNCNPINFKLNENCLSITGYNDSLMAQYPYDAGILQKTFLTNTKVPVFIIAGLGTTGTEASGKFLNNNCIALGKLFGNSSFCVLLKTDITKGSNYYEIKAIYPRPKIYRALLYLRTYLKWREKKIFLSN